MNRFVLALLAAAALSACDQPSVRLTPEERLLSEMFMLLNSATAYDEYCNQSKFIDAGNPNLYGNISAVSSRFYAAIYNNRPEKTRKDVENQVKYQGQYALTRAREVLQNKGCESPETGKFEQALQMYTQNPPATITDRIDAELQRQGVTPAPKRRD